MFLFELIGGNTSELYVLYVCSYYSVRLDCFLRTFAIRVQDSIEPSGAPQTAEAAVRVTPGVQRPTGVRTPGP